MQFRFDSLSDFIAMSGHGPFIWACYIAVAIALCALALAPKIRMRGIAAEVQRQEKIAQRRAQQQSKHKE